LFWGWYFGYKDHVLADEEYKFIRGYAVTVASVYDSVAYLSILPEKVAYPDQEAFGDSAYSSQEIESKLTERGYLPMICEKGYRNKLLSEEQQKMNKMKSKVRCRVEQIFGAMKVRCRDELLRSSKVINVNRAAIVRLRRCAAKCRTFLRFCIILRHSARHPQSPYREIRIRRCYRIGLCF